MLVSQILKDKSDDGVATIAPGKTVADATEMLSSRRIGALVVSNMVVLTRGRTRPG